MSHQNTALVLSLLLHALVLSCALVFAGNVVQVQPPVRIELAIAATGGDGGPVQAAAAPAAKKAEAAPARPRRVVKTEPARKKTPVRPQQVAAVRTPAPVVQPTPADPAPAVTRPEQQPAPAELTRTEPPTAAGEPVQSVAATTTATAQAQAGPGGRSGAVRTGSPVPAGSWTGRCRPLPASSRATRRPPGGRTSRVDPGAVRGRRARLGGPGQGTRRRTGRVLRAERAPHRARLAVPAGHGERGNCPGPGRADHLFPAALTAPGTISNENGCPAAGEAECAPAPVSRKKRQPDVRSRATPCLRRNEGIPCESGTDPPL